MASNMAAKLSWELKSQKCVQVIKKHEQPISISFRRAVVNQTNIGCECFILLKIQMRLSVGVLEEKLEARRKFSDFH